VAKQTEINIISNRILKKKYDLLGINWCEIGKLFHYKWLFSGCMKVRQGYAHDKKRIEYRKNPEQLSSVKHTIGACNFCHGIIENNSLLTKVVFIILRGAMKDPKVKVSAKTKAKLNKKKPDWMRPHKCIYCGRMVTGLLCPFCDGLSVKEDKR